MTNIKDFQKIKYEGIPDKFKPYVYALLSSDLNEIRDPAAFQYWNSLSNSLIKESSMQAKCAGLTVKTLLGTDLAGSYNDVKEYLNDPLSNFLSGDIETCLEILLSYWHRNKNQTNPLSQPSEISRTIDLLRALTILSWSITYKVWTSRTKEALQKINYLASRYPELWTLKLINLIVSHIQSYTTFNKQSISFENKRTIALSIPTEKMKQDQWFVIPYRDKGRIIWYEPGGWCVGWSNYDRIFNPEKPWLLLLKEGMVVN